MEPKFVPVELCASDRQLSKPAMHGNIHCALKRTKSIGSKYHFAVLLQTFLLWEWAYNFIIVFLIIIPTDHKQVCAVCPSVHMTEPSTYSAVIFGELNTVILFNWYRLDFRKPEHSVILFNWYSYYGRGHACSSDNERIFVKDKTDVIQAVRTRF